jgi:hypothetical protein
MHIHTFNARRIRLHVSVLVLVVAIFAGCPVTFISSYDEATDKGITALQKSVEGLLSQLDQTAVPDYKGLKGTYDGLRVELSSLHLRNEARPKNTLTVRQLDELKAILDKLEELHKAGKLNQAMVAPTRDAFNQAFRALLKLELEKKELAKKQ